MKLSESELRKIIRETLLVEGDTRMQEGPLTDFAQGYSRFIMDAFPGIDQSEVFRLVHAAIGVTGRESKYGTSSRYKGTDWFETLGSTVDHYTGVGRQMSIGPAQIKYTSFVEAVPKEYAELIGVSTPSDLTDDLTAVKAAYGMLLAYYSKAKSLGYSRNSPGHISGAVAPADIQSIFNSTGNAALDLAVTAFNSGPGNLRRYPQGADYIPCKGPACVEGGSGVASYGYVAKVAEYMNSKRR